MSLAFPQDWFACDSAVNDQLHSRALPEETAARACTPVRGGIAPVHLIGLSPRTPANLLVDRAPVPTVSPEALSQATPEMLGLLTQSTCGHIAELLDVDPQTVTGCSGEPANVSGHIALVTRLTMTARNGQSHKVRIYRIPYDQGELTLQFEYLAASGEGSEARIDFIVGSARIEPGSFVVQTVTLAPAPGISVALPAGWMACDDATNALLGGARDTLGVRPKSCASVPGTQRLAAFNPQPLQNVSVGVDYKTEKDLTESQLANLSADRLTELTAKVCDSVTKPIKDENRPVDSCALSLDQIAGHQALVVTVVAALSGDDQTARDRNRIYLVPYDQGFVTFEFIVPLASESVAEPLIDAVIKSVTIQ